jgi:hypothetical protein
MRRSSTPDPDDMSSNDYSLEHPLKQVSQEQLYGTAVSLEGRSIDDRRPGSHSAQYICPHDEQQTCSEISSSGLWSAVKQQTRLLIFSLRVNRYRYIYGFGWPPSPLFIAVNMWISRCTLCSHASLSHPLQSHFTSQNNRQQNPQTELPWTMAALRFPSVIGRMD